LDESGYTPKAKAVSLGNLTDKADKEKVVAMDNRPAISAVIEVGRDGVSLLIIMGL